MATKTANRAHHVVILAYPGVTLMDVAGPLQVFTTARRGDAAAYDVTLAAADEGPVSTDVGTDLVARSVDMLEQVRVDTLLVAGGTGVFDAITDGRVIEHLQRHAPGARRVGSTCLGAFALAAAGLLEGRRAATHWDWADTLSRRFPDVTVDRNAIYVNDGNVWTSAGVSAGIDLALAMVDEDLGHEAALAVARRLVVYLKRTGGQSQFSNALALQSADRDGAFDRLHAWILDNLRADLRVEHLAAIYGTSPRTFVRHYKAATGQTPAKAVEMLRVEAARGLLEQGERHLERVASRCGFDHLETMRRSFLRCLGVPPAAYREHFSGNTAHHGDESSRPAEDRELERECGTACGGPGCTNAVTASGPRIQATAGDRDG